jgi:NAD(P)-dependent dehydrogenase (short-subunit alcohol dehydrogenase family)
VTGAASGIGLAVAERLLAEGGTVVGADVNPPPTLGERFTFVTADVSDESAVAEVFAALPDRLDGVVHAAGIASGGPVHLLDKAEWDRVIAINLTGTFFVAKAALSRMIEQPRVDGERGSIVTLASVEGLEGTAGGSGYNAAKGGVVLLTKNMRSTTGRAAFGRTQSALVLSRRRCWTVSFACREWRAPCGRSPTNTRCSGSGGPTRLRPWRPS